MIEKINIIFIKITLVNAYLLRLKIYKYVINCKGGPHVSINN